MKKRFTLFSLLVTLLVVPACNHETENEEVDAFQELTVLQVQIHCPGNRESW